jgi:hypothetical protein
VPTAQASHHDHPAWTLHHVAHCHGLAGPTLPGRRARRLLCRPALRPGNLAARGRAFRRAMRSPGANTSNSIPKSSKPSPSRASTRLRSKSSCRSRISTNSICAIPITSCRTQERRNQKTYGADFAKGCAESDRLSDVLHKMDEPSLSKLVRDHEAGKLEQICSEAA